MCFGYARHDSARTETRIGSDDRLLPKGECALCLCAARYWPPHLKTERPTLVGAAPDVLAFHQAPLEFGGDGALLVLLSIPENSASLVTHIRWDRHTLLIEFRSLTTFAAILFKLQHKCQHLRDGHE